MSRAVVDTVRKLLRFAARGTGPEALLAGERAEELMARHGVRVRLEEADEYERAVAGVNGVFWREQLLSAAAHMLGCRAKKSKHPDGDSSLVGDRADVELAERAYQHLAAEIMREVSVLWRKFCEQNALIESLREVCANVWFRAFTDSAATRIADLHSPPDAMSPAAHAPDAVAASTEPSDADKELTKLDAAVDELEGAIGPLAQSVLRIATTKGAQLGDRLARASAPEQRTLRA